MPIADYFSPDYDSARKQFREAAERAHAAVRSHVLSGHRGSKGEALAIDVARLGATDADCALLVLSGTHGVEGFCGSGCQVGFLADRLYEALPASACAIFIHALNPYGFSWQRRVNEDGVDLNRNFIDHSKAHPSSAAYEELHPLLIPGDWHGESRQTADLGLAEYIRQHGFRQLQSAITAGQYTRPDGLFYGGHTLSWSAKTLLQILDEHALNRMRRVAVLDLHTGLGPKGYGEPILIPCGPGELERARRWYGSDIVDIEADEAIATQVGGSVPQGVAGAIGGSEVTFVTLEFGTRPATEVLTALRADHWLHAGHRSDDQLRASIQQQMREAFYCEESAWQAAVYGRAADFAFRACRGLGS